MKFGFSVSRLWALGFYRVWGLRIRTVQGLGLQGLGLIGAEGLQGLGFSDFRAEGGLDGGFCRGLLWLLLRGILGVQIIALMTAGGLGLGHSASVKGSTLLAAGTLNLFHLSES